MDAFSRLKQIGLFTDLADADLARICGDVVERRFAAGEVVFAEGDYGDQACVVVDGTVEVSKATEGREVVIAVREPGAVIGEMALLRAAPRMATVRARSAATLLMIPKRTLDQLLESSTSAARAMFRSLIERMQETNEQLRHSERMAQLGTLTAGVAHELNNPAAAVRRAARLLDHELDRYTALLLEPVGDAGPLRQRALALAKGGRTSATDRAAPSDPLARSDTEVEVEDWLAGHGVAEPWQLAPELVDAGIGLDQLEALGTDAAGPALATAARLLVATLGVRALIDEIGEGSRRLSTIVQALKGYSYLDRAPVQDVDVVQGLEDTLVLLGHKLRGVRVVRDVTEPLPTITAFGSALNQVWTNLIDNAADAVADIDDRTPTITLRAFGDGDDVVVEVEDNGRGIPEDAQAKVFDAFFTTKPPGRGTGLGLQISYRIVTLDHGGALTFESRPGRTVFRVVLPVRGRAATAPRPSEGGAATMSSPICEHLAAVESGPVPEGGCEECLAAGDTWVHLRFCVACGKVGCCDDSKNRHARRHGETSGHPVIRSKEPGENWAWCLADDIGVVLDGAVDD